ncbi:MAG: glycosyltransferase family 4 protein [Anaerolineaceae bacterium]|jgi:glycosyltransferase involved in cell wall biosynthesis|nr:glycosyltransferase family 4 protein [Anaerolineaceae bacterium]
MAKNIGIFHYQVGHTDGVSLELEKWQRVFEERGHTVYLCAGDLGSAEGILIREMYHHLPEIERLYDNTFQPLHDFNAEGYRAELARWVDILETRFRAFIREKAIDFIVPENVWCVAANPAVGIALENVRREFDIPALAHNHDFFWERQNGVALSCAAAIEMAQVYTPPRGGKIQHVVINSLARQQLLRRKGIDSTVVPNIFDFQAPPWVKDSYNADFRERIGLKEKDVLLLQATRIVPRKGIELAIDFARALDTPRRRAVLQEKGLFDGRSFDEDSRIVLVLAGYARDDPTGVYFQKLKDKAAREGVDMIHVGDMITHERESKAGEKTFSLWDTYVFADFVTYPSLWEGWGNQFLEAVRAKLPVMLFEYPVYEADIGPRGFEVVSLGTEVTGENEAGLVKVSADTIGRAADEAVVLLTNAAARQKAVEHNFALGQKHYSMDALRAYLGNLMND